MGLTKQQSEYLEALRFLSATKVDQLSDQELMIIQEEIERQPWYQLATEAYQDLSYLEVPRLARLRLATRCIQCGVDIERVCRAAGWREFEDLAALILEYNDYRTTKHLRFKHEGKGYEVDVLALKAPWSLVVECKRWKRSRQPSALRRAAGIQRRKTSILGDLLSNPNTRLDIRPGLPVRLIPVVMTLSETSLEIEGGVPMVPVAKFQDFLNEFAGYIEDLTVFRSPDNVTPM